MKLKLLAIAGFWAGIALFSGSAQGATISIDSLQIGGWDGYIHLYVGSFDPTNQLAGLLASNDDGPGGIGTSQITGLTLLANVDYFLVTSGFFPTDFGAYETTISGDGLPLILSGDTTGGPLWFRSIEGTSEISDFQVNYQIRSFQIVTPEPFTLSLVAIGLAAMGILNRRRG